MTDELRAALTRIAGGQGHGPSAAETCAAALAEIETLERERDEQRTRLNELRAEILESRQQFGRLCDRLERGVRGESGLWPDWVNEAAEAIRHANNVPWLPDLLAKLEWQGGTIHDALQAVARMVAFCKRATAESAKELEAWKIDYNRVEQRLLTSHRAEKEWEHRVKVLEAENEKWKCANAESAAWLAECIEVLRIVEWLQAHGQGGRFTCPVCKGWHNHPDDKDGHTKDCRLAAALSEQPAATPALCSRCGGRGGWEDGDEGQWVVCLKCQGGTSAVRALGEQPGEESASEPSTCPRCEGTGRYSSLGEPSRECAVCNGTGKIGTAEETMERDPSWLIEDRINHIKQGFDEASPSEVLAALGEIRVLRRRIAELEAKATPAPQPSKAVAHLTEALIAAARREGMEEAAKIVERMGYAVTCQDQIDVAKEALRTIAAAIRKAKGE